MIWYFKCPNVCILFSDKDLKELLWIYACCGGVNIKFSQWLYSRSSPHISAFIGSPLNVFVKSKQHGGNLYLYVLRNAGYVFIFKVYVAMAANSKMVTTWPRKNLFRHLHKTISCNKLRKISAKVLLGIWNDSDLFLKS